MLQAVLKKFFFHFKLGHILENNEEARIFIKKILGLAYLPEELQPEEFRKLKEGLSPNLKHLFRDFNTYFQRQWIEKERFSVFGLTNRTNNELESYNSILFDVHGTHPSPWSFLSKFDIFYT